jgi:hypothetical protein
MLISYLFGAGASCEVLPLVDDIPGRMQAMCLRLQGYSDQIDAKLQTELKALITDIKELSGEAADHASIDTYARKLFLIQNKEKLVWLKKVLTFYFLLEQFFLDKETDRRYDLFWTSLAGKTSTDLPKNIRILSWNYDLQFELSFSNYIPQKNFDEIQSFLGVVEKINDKRKGDVMDHFGIYKLNGTANTIKNFDGPFINDAYILDEIKKGITVEELNEFLTTSAYLRNDKKSKMSLSFAWEDESYKSSYQKTILELIKEEISVTEILVIIGYSFPYFNRKIDRELIRSMRLKKIYIQDKNPDPIIDTLKSIIGDNENLEIRTVSVSKQFFLPPELD